MPIKGPRDHRAQKALTYTLFLALPVTFFLTAYVYAVGYTGFVSLHSWDGISPTMRFVGLDNYGSLMGQSRFWHAVANNLKWLAFYLVAPSTLGLALALLVDGKLKGEGVIKTLIFLPYIITPVAVAAVWRWLYLPDGGLVNTVLDGIGLSGVASNWLGDRHIASYSVMAAALWSTTGFSFLVFFSGLRSIPAELFEAARIDGASAFTIFRRITIPHLWPSTVLVLGLFGIEAMRLFDLVWSMTGGGPSRASEVLATQLYDVAFATFQMGKASAIGIVQLCLAAVLILPYIAYITRNVEEAAE
ncbi:carbohydrate ABC transporter membrane protein 1 (CUT1 family) [Rhodobacter aestuarii]|uniref:Carbohydrate ABC transporter membrane protein 1, CUT1 family n=1 Tax=Rhodobacter aestuarii TaxID=453582 RepID=A0A1N7JUC9_9RHOB|nr:MULTISPECIES: sugar ABC transporter permease [Rhodobacter]PTV95989.1 carbohydrate ABC transporter membrane protein 1 (CUT1 family) [Rhodobacter aestuarii]SIS52836.1 carbohydrate ABC transporter membrane protein 1, CUT1 family [Rhodobacter aestuarii]SOC10395.1 carbohydrate ABC transporter membrane protein 1 (CUT1 family) [Rhodobacter sp. JA431]